ncbi:hypothetical protein ACOSQ3_006888 [Xanthoceras sorbifolium]
MESSRAQRSPMSQLNSTEEEINVYLEVMKTVAFQVKKSETVRNLKVLFCEKEGISEDIQDLFFAGDRLQDDERLVDYCIHQDSRLHLVLQNHIGTRLFVKIPRNQKTIAVEAMAHHTVRHIKSLIQVKEGIQSDEFTLLYEGKQLKEDMPVASLNLKSEATLHLVFCQKPVISIFVKAPAGDILKLEIPVLLTVCDVKFIVGSMIGMSVSNHIMIYGGEQLEDCMTLAFYNVKEECMLEMCPPSIQIFVRTPSEEIVKLKLNVLFTIHDVKAIVGGMIGSPVSNQDLFYAGKKLEDSKTIACYDIKDKFVLELLPPQIQIFVKTWSGKTVTLDVQLSDTIKDVKDKLFDKVHIPPELQNFVFAGKQLEENRDLASYNVQEHSTLHMVVAPNAKIIPVSLYQFRAAISDSTTISDLKRMIQHEYGSPVKELLFSHVTLENDRTLGDYHLGKNSRVDAVMKDINATSLSI